MEKGILFLFLSPDCPLCQSYVPEINMLYDVYGSKGISIYAVFPGKFVSRDSVNTFISHYGLKTHRIVMDSMYSWTEKFKATVTPEAFLVNSRCEIVYRGRIDDKAYETGRKKLIAGTHELLDAVNSLDKGETIRVDSTRAVGCLIE